MWWTAWIVRAQPFAYNQLELLPHEFWDLTPNEFNDLRDAYYRRKRREAEMTAHWIVTLINHYPMRSKGAKTLRVDQLIGPDPMKKRKGVKGIT